MMPAFSDGDFSLYCRTDFTKQLVLDLNLLSTNQITEFAFPNLGDTLVGSYRDYKIDGSWTFIPGVMFRSGILLGDGSGIPVFAGALDANTITADRSYSFPDASGTVALTGTTLAHYGITDAQGLDATLTALAGLNSTAGVVEQTGADAFTKRALLGPGSVPSVGATNVTAFGGTLSAGQLGAWNLANYDVAGGTAAGELANAPTAGLYLITTYLQVRSTLDNSITLTFSWTDNYGATSMTTTALAITAGGKLVQANRTLIVYVASGNVTLSAAGPTTGTIDLYVRMVRL